MSYFHTRATCSVHLVMSTIFVSDRQLVKLTCDMICRTGIRIPVCVNAVGVGDGIGHLLIVLIFLIEIPTLTGTSAVMLEADLALGIITVLRTLLLLLLGTTTSPVAAAWRGGCVPSLTAASVAAPATSAMRLAAPLVRQFCRGVEASVGAIT